MVLWVASLLLLPQLLSRPSASSTSLEKSRVTPLCLRSLDLEVIASGKQWLDQELVDSRDGIQEIGANLDRESVVSTIFSSRSKGIEIEIKTLCIR